MLSSLAYIKLRDAFWILNFHVEDAQSGGRNNERARLMAATK